MDERVSWVLAVEVKAGALDDFITLMDEMVGATYGGEPEALAYEWFLLPDGPVDEDGGENDGGRTCHIYERYTNSAAAARHLAWFTEVASKPFMEVASLKSITLYGNPDAAVRAALAPYGTVFMKQIGGFYR